MDIDVSINKNGHNVKMDVTIHTHDSKFEFDT